MQTTTSYKVSDSLFLVRQVINQSAPAKPAAPDATNHIVVIDCSGSMYYELPKIREQLKKKVPKLLNEKDTLSIIWFSGRNQFGVLLEGSPVASLTDLQDVNRLIDRWLKTVCLTGFKQPLIEAGELASRVVKNNPGPVSLFFMSDGCDNQWPRGEILKAVETAAGTIASCTFVEYGYYADRPTLTAMAQKAGGTLIFAKDFNKYAPLFESALQKTISGAPRVEATIAGDAIGGFAFNGDGTDLYSFEVTGNTVTIPEDTAEIVYLSPTAIGDKGEPIVELSKKLAASKKPIVNDAIDAAYAAVSLFSLRMKPDVVLPLLKSLGDVTFITKFGGCFGKQKYSEFMEAAKVAAFGKGRFEDGWDPKKVPADDAFTQLDFLRVLASDESNRVLLDSKDFSYNKIGRGTEAATGLSKDEEKQVKELTTKIASADGNEAAKLQGEVDTIVNRKRPDPLKFVADEEVDGYAVNSLTFNEKRPNVSFLVRKEGSVELKGKPKEHKKLPKALPTHIHRNYTVIKDGLTNIELLPVRMTGGTVRDLVAAGFPMEAVQGLEGEDASKAVTRVKKASKDRPVSFVVSLSALPVINRNMVKNASAKVLFEKTLEVTKARAAQKVFNTILKEEFPKSSEGFKLMYGEDATSWLKECGVTDYNGFNPRRVQSSASDYYMGKELHVKVKNLSTIPSLNDVRKRIANGKITPSAALMVPVVEEVDKYKRSKAYKSAPDKDAAFKTWLLGKKAESTKTVRGLLFELAQIKFSVIVGQTWFTEFKSLDENSLEIDHEGTPVPCTVEMKEVQVSI